MFMRLSNGRSINRDQIITIDTVPCGNAVGGELIITFFDGQEIQVNHPTQESAEAEHEKILRAKYTWGMGDEEESMNNGLYR